jgi:uncharacterized protein YcbX
MSANEVRIEELWTYPVKSLAGIPSNTAVIGEAGFVHDRRFMLVDDDGRFLTQRQVPELARFSVAVISGLNMQIGVPGYGTFTHPLSGVEGEPVDTAVHGKPCVGLDQGIDASEFFSGFLQRGVRLLGAAQDEKRSTNPKYHDALSGNRVDFADGFSFLLTSRASLDELHRRLKLPYWTVPMDRFRPNIVVNAPLLEPFAEDEWSVLFKGGVQLIVRRACTRCQIPSIIQRGPNAGEKGSINVLTEFLASRRGIDLADPDKAKGRFFGQNIVHSLGSVGLSLNIGDGLVITEAKTPNVDVVA